MSHRIHVSISTQRHTGPGIDGSRLRVDCSEPHLMPEAVFRYRALPVIPGQAALSGAFCGVCSPADLEEFPEAEPFANADPPWYRLNYVDLVFRSHGQAVEAKEAILAELRQLVYTLDEMDDLEVTEEIWIGTTPAESSSASSSSSA